MSTPPLHDSPNQEEHGIPSTSSTPGTEGNINHHNDVTPGTSHQNHTGPRVSATPCSTRLPKKVTKQHDLFRMRHARNMQGPNTPFKRIRLEQDSSIPTRIRTLPTPVVTRPRGQGSNLTAQKIESSNNANILTSILDDLILPPKITKQVSPASANTARMGTTNPPLSTPQLDILKEDLALSDSSDDETEPPLQKVVQQVQVQHKPVRTTKFLNTHMSNKKVTHKPRQNISQRERAAATSRPPKPQGDQPLSLEKACSDLLTDLSQIMELKNKTNLANLTPTLGRIHKELRHHLNKYGY